MKKFKKLILIPVFLVLFLAIWWVWKSFSFSGNILISTDKSEYERGKSIIEYERGKSIIVKIVNETNKNVCFSSCYPYYLEKKNGDWKSYLYDHCPKMDLIGNCIKPKSEKFFQIEDLSYAKEGLHRLAIPVCIGCNLVDNFKEDKRFYSNEFSIK